MRTCYVTTTNDHHLVLCNKTIPDIYWLHAPHHSLLCQHLHDQEELLGLSDTLIIAYKYNFNYGNTVRVRLRALFNSVYNLKLTLLISCQHKHG